MGDRAISASPCPPGAPPILGTFQGSAVRPGPAIGPGPLAITPPLESVTLRKSSPSRICRSARNSERSLPPKGLRRNRRLSCASRPRNSSFPTTPRPSSATWVCIVSSAVSRRSLASVRTIDSMRPVRKIIPTPIGMIASSERATMSLARSDLMGSSLARPSSCPPCHTPPAGRVRYLVWRYPVRTGCAPSHPVSSLTHFLLSPGQPGSRRSEFRIPD